MSSSPGRGGRRSGSVAGGAGCCRAGRRRRSECGPWSSSRVVVVVELARRSSSRRRGRTAAVVAGAAAAAAAAAMTSRRRAACGRSARMRRFCRRGLCHGLRRRGRSMRERSNAGSVECWLRRRNWLGCSAVSAYALPDDVGLGSMWRLGSKFDGSVDAGGDEGGGGGGGGGGKMSMLQRSMRAWSSAAALRPAPSTPARSMLHGSRSAPSTLGSVDCHLRSTSLAPGLCALRSSRLCLMCRWPLLLRSPPRRCAW